MLFGVESGPQIATALIVENLPNAKQDSANDKKSYHRNEEENEGVEAGCGRFEMVHWIGLEDKQGRMFNMTQCEIKFSHGVAQRE